MNHGSVELHDRVKSGFILVDNKSLLVMFAVRGSSSGTATTPGRDEDDSHLRTTGSPASSELFSSDDSGGLHLRAHIIAASKIQTTFLDSIWPSRKTEASRDPTKAPRRIPTSGMLVHHEWICVCAGSLWQADRRVRLFSCLQRGRQMRSRSPACDVTLARNTKNPEARSSQHAAGCDRSGPRGGGMAWLGRDSDTEILPSCG